MLPAANPDDQAVDAGGVERADRLTEVIGILDAIEHHQQRHAAGLLQELGHREVAALARKCHDATMGGAGHDLAQVGRGDTSDGNLVIGGCVA